MADTLEMQNPQGEPLPQGASIAEPMPQGASVIGTAPQNIQQNAPSEEESDTPGIKGDPYSDIGYRALKGFVKGAGSTAAGIGRLADKAGRALGVDKAGAYLLGGKEAVQHVPNPEQTDYAVGQRAFDEITTPRDLAEKVGFGAETLTEFLLGDEALKGMSLAEKLANSAKVAEVLEKFPRVLKALKMGANVSKAQELLGPEEKALLQSHPILARLVSHGMDAIRQGIVQTAQTEARTGGDTEEALKQGAEMTGTSAALGVPFSIVGGIASKGGKAAKTVQELGKAAEAAPEKTEVADLGSNMVEQAEKKMHTDFEAGIQKIKNLIGDEQVELKGSPFQKTAEQILESGEGAHPLEKLAGETAPVSDFAKKYIKGVASAFEKPVEEGGEETVSKLVDASGKPIRTAATATAEAEPPVTVGIDDLIKARQTLGERMRSLGFDSTADRADRKAYSMMIDGIDDTIEKLSRQANPGDHTRYMKDAIESIAPGKQLGDLTTKELSQVAQKAAEIQRTTSPSGLYDQIRNQYRTTKKLFDDPEARRAINSIKTGNLDDIGRQLSVGTKSGHVIDTLNQIIGPENMSKLSDQVFQTWIKDAATGLDKDGNVVSKAFDPDKLIRKWVSLKPNVREQLFQMTPERAEAYSNLVKQVADASSFKKLVKYGMLPATLGTAGVVHGPLAAFFGALAGLGVESFGKARDILDSIANNPKTWNAVAKVASATGSKAAGVASTLTKYGVAKGLNQLTSDDEAKRRLFSGAASPLSQ